MIKFKKRTISIILISFLLLSINFSLLLGP